LNTNYNGNNCDTLNHSSTMMPLTNLVLTEQKACS